MEWMPPKDPEDVEVYSADFAAWLAEVEDDELTDTEWTVPDGITKQDMGFAGTKATVKLTGGAANVTYPVLCHATSSSGRERDWTLKIPVRHQ